LRGFTCSIKYAIAGTVPSGTRENNVLVFPYNNIRLIGAVFPPSGIPELPKAPTIVAEPFQRRMLEEKSRKNALQMMLQQQQHDTSNSAVSIQMPLNLGKILIYF
jgi:hypothetical protein